MLYGIEVWQLAAGLVGAVALGFLAFMSAMARFLKRPSPSEAIIRIGRANTDVFIGRSTWIVPVLHRAATMSLSTIGPDHPARQPRGARHQGLHFYEPQRPSSTSGSSRPRTT